eukprot:CAMPEP_0171155340 /NCGR_PEP_ID=MMETSP0790-20130122/845_1 /TAXON_ID=2925 /ORGANISM="Alexandrium catenella, Strain OF101" /LENGTH=65 /DNA_ID=CAMNT_0011619547 /DNA_START=39 /DNA_END=232 /DNA_ORIENTATION=-
MISPARGAWGSLALGAAGKAEEGVENRGTCKWDGARRCASGAVSSYRHYATTRGSLARRAMPELG